MAINDSFVVFAFSNIQLSKPYPILKHVHAYTYVQKYFNKNFFKCSSIHDS